MKEMRHTSTDQTTSNSNSKLKQVKHDMDAAALQYGHAHLETGEEERRRLHMREGTTHTGDAQNRDSLEGALAEQMRQHELEQMRKMQELYGNGNGKQNGNGGNNGNYTDGDMLNRNRGS